MKFTLITKSGRVMSFFVLAVAELYESIYGGVLIKDEIYAVEYAELLAETI